MCTNEVRIDNIEIERVNLKSVELVSGGFGGSVTFLVAADDAVPKTKVKADFVCDGIEDHIEILEAIDKLPSPGGTIVLSEGSFNLSSKITFPDKGIRLVGQGLPGRDFDDNATILNFTFTEKGNCFEFTPKNHTAQSIERLAIYGDGSNTEIGIYFDNVSFKQVKNVAIYNVVRNGIRLVNASSQCLFEFVYCRDLDCNAFQGGYDSTANTYIHCQASRSSQLGISATYIGFITAGVGETYINCVSERYNRGIHLGAMSYACVVEGFHSELNNYGFWIQGSEGDPARAHTIIGGLSSHDSSNNAWVENSKGIVFLGVFMGETNSHNGYNIRETAEDTLIIGGVIEATVKKVNDLGMRTIVLGVPLD